MGNKDVTFLLVDDDEDDVIMVKRAFTKSKILNKLDVVNDGEEALDYLRREGSFSGAQHSNPDLILLDLNMKKVSGYEVLEELKRDPRFSSIPVVVLTSSNRAEDIKRVYSLGANSFITKPVSADAFIKAIVGIESYWVQICALP